MRRNAPARRRVLPQRIWRHAVEDNAGRALDEQRQQVPEDFGRDGDDAVRREQSAEDVRVGKRVRRRQLRQHACRQAQVYAD